MRTQGSKEAQESGNGLADLREGALEVKLERRDVT
jgi:hypothetical protein